MDSHEHFFQNLTSEEQHLLIIRDFLYDGAWDDVIQDLVSRKGGKPFVFKLNSRIDDDLERIEKLRNYEETHGVNLAMYLIQSGKFPELSSVMAEHGESDPEVPSKTTDNFREKQT